MPVQFSSAPAVNGLWTWHRYSVPGASTRSASTNEGSALRSYLRFLAAQGLCRPGLVAAVPTIPRRTASQLPRYVEQEDIEALIAICDTATSIGLRDRAVLLLLARLALRPGEVAALRLDDIDWQQALVAVSGKSRRSAALPLPQETGDTLKDYILRARPRTACPTVFPRFRAPHGCLSASAVSAIVRRAMKQAGIDGEGLPAAYVFRHSRATHLLRGGAAPEAVGALLRHQSLKTTALYARVDAHRPPPRLLSLEQICQVMDAALELPPAGSITPVTFHYLIGLVAATGLRRAEATGLRLDDATADGLQIRHAKGRKQRLVPLHGSVRTALARAVHLSRPCQRY